jgi:cytidine deaminase
MLSDDTKKLLISKARDAARNAYTPYSKYCVGAALLTGDGRIFTGCNVENASYGLTICAERSAVFSARCQGASQFTALAVFAPNPPSPVPCGACRQVLSEGGNNPLIIVVHSDLTTDEYPLDMLLPHSFSL